MAKSKKAAAEVTLERRGKDRREDKERRKEQTAVAVERRQVERREKVSRRRQIDPTTCERDYTDEEVAFMRALDQYKRASGRMFPTCSEVLEVLRGLGYERRETPLATPENEQPAIQSPIADAATVEPTAADLTELDNN